MKKKSLFERAVTSGLVMVIMATYSMVALASPATAVGELTVSNKGTGAPMVTVNGEPVTSGRTIFSASTISTPEGSEAVLNLGKAGKIQLAGGTVFTINADGGSLSGSLSSGSVTALSTSTGITVKTLSGEAVKLNSGESASASSAVPARRAKPGPGGLDWWYWAAIIGGVSAAVVVALVVSNNDNSASPVR